MKKYLSVLTLLAVFILSGCAGYYYEGEAYEAYPKHRYYNPNRPHYRGNYYSSGGYSRNANAPVRVIGGGGGYYQSH